MTTETDYNTMTDNFNEFCNGEYKSFSIPYSNTFYIELDSVDYHKISNVDVNKTIKFKIDVQIEIMKEIYREFNRSKHYLTCLTLPTKT